MKKTYLILLAALFTAGVFAQSPEKMSYQAVIRNSSGILVTDTQIGMEINILQGSASGPVVYTETQTPTTNANGLVSIEIGGEAGFSAINWANNTYFIETKTAVVPPLTTYTIIVVSQLLSAPYALNAKIADSIIGGFAGYGDLVHYIGELYGGGIVVSVWQESGIEKGLIASLTDVSESAQWSSITGTAVGATARSPVNGQANTTAIVANGDISGAAYLCDNYSAGGFSDWYLPALWEINKCYDAAFVVNTILGATDGFPLVCHYWSSTELNDTRAMIQNFYTGNAEYHIEKSEAHRVRAVRRF
jgi:hypothetical protein